MKRVREMTYNAWRRGSLRWIVARYCKTLLFVLTTRVTRYILPEVTPSVTSYFFTETNVYMISMFVD